MLRKLLLLTSLSIMFSSCAHSLGHYVVVSNNIEHDELVCFGFSSNGIPLKPYEQIEIVIEDNVSLSTSNGHISGVVLCDTTIELNDDCYYIGEQKYCYWKEEND